MYLLCALVVFVVGGSISCLKIIGLCHSVNQFLIVKTVKKMLTCEHSLLQSS